MAVAFDVLGEPTRRRILDLLLERPRMVGELTEQLGLTQPGTSKHLRVLREAGLVRVRREAQRRWYELRPEPLAEVDAWLEPYRRLWADRLDALERHLDSMPDLAPGLAPDPAPGASAEGAAGATGATGASPHGAPEFPRAPAERQGE
jgi:DNA-binding transcriptional ArsR family regulator